MASIKLNPISAKRIKAPGLEIAEMYKFPDAIRKAVTDDQRVTAEELALADYLEFKNKHPKFKPAYNTSYLKKDQLEKQKAAGKIRYDWASQDYDGDGVNDILVWDKKGLKAFNGNIMKQSSYKPDYDYYSTHLTQADRDNQHIPDYFGDKYDIPEPEYNELGHMTNNVEYRSNYDQMKNAYEGYRIPKMKRKPKTQSIRQFFIDKFINPIAQVCRLFGIKLHLPLYQQIISETYIPFMLANIDPSQKQMLEKYFNKSLPGFHPDASKEEKHTVYMIGKQLTNAADQFKQTLVSDAQQYIILCIETVCKLINMTESNENYEAFINTVYSKFSVPSPISSPHK